MFMQKIRFLQLLYCLKITSKFFIKNFKIINCGKFIGTRKTIFSAKINITLGWIYKKSVIFLTIPYLTCFSSEPPNKYRKLVFADILGDVYGLEASSRIYPHGT